MYLPRQMEAGKVFGLGISPPPPALQSLQKGLTTLPLLYEKVLFSAAHCLHSALSCSTGLFARCKARSGCYDARRHARIGLLQFRRHAEDAYLILHLHSAFMCRSQIVLSPHNGNSIQLKKCTICFAPKTAPHDVAAGSRKLWVGSVDRVHDTTHHFFGGGVNMTRDR